MDLLWNHLDAIEPGQNVAVVDDLLATGGTMDATVKLEHQRGGYVAGLASAVKLDFLKGRGKFAAHDLFSRFHYHEWLPSH